jgi:predicted metalloprotease with PDZ domain
MPLLWLIASCGALACDAQQHREDIENPAVSYTFEYGPGTTRAIRVVLRVRSQSGEASRFAVAPSWGGVKDCERFIHDISARDSNGNFCHISSDGPHGWKVAHRPGAVLELTYKLMPAKNDPLADQETHYEPVVRDDLLHLIGETGLIFPQWLENSGPLHIEVKYSGFTEHGWKIATSFDADNGHVICPLQKFRHALFLAGKIRVYDRNIRGGLLRVAIQGDDWQFEDREMVDLLARIIAAEREFMQDFSDPYYLVTIVPSGPRVSPQAYSFAGTCLTNCFALFLSPGTGVDSRSLHRSELLQILAHESFHRWNYGRIRPGEPEELGYWFSEGFTDFYASRILRHTGLINDSQWIEQLNKTCKSLWLSPVANAPARKMLGEFWSRQEVQKLPYQRGEIVALMLDEQIRRGGKGRTLDDFMREVFSSAINGDASPSDQLLARMAQWTTPRFADSIRGIVVDGALPDPPQVLTTPAADKSTLEQYPYDPGFDIDASLNSRIITAVRAGSAAHAAGLRDGQSILGWSILPGDPDRQFELTVRGQNGPLPIRFLPRGEQMIVPRYELRMRSKSRDNPFFKGG